MGKFHSLRLQTLHIREFYISWLKGVTSFQNGTEVSCQPISSTKNKMILGLLLVSNLVGMRHRNLRKQLAGIVSIVRMHEIIDLHVLAIEVLHRRN